MHRYGTVSLAEYRGETREGKAFGFSSTPAEPMFGYKGKWGVKVYRPMSEVRFVYGGHTGDNYCFGLEQLPSKGDLLFLTGGEKDVLTLAAHGFHAICFNSETSVIPAKTVRKLVYRFKHIVLLYDTDKTGLECSEKHRAQLSEYGVKRLVLPLPGTKAEKDVTDYFKAGHTREELMGLFLKLLDTLYGDTMAVLKSCEIDYDHPPEQAVAIVTAGEVPLGSEENILCITGGEGTGKSNYTAALVAGAIMERETDADLLGVRVEPNRKGRAVLLYDTEQSEQQLYKNTGRLLRRAGRERMPEYLHVYCLTGMSRSERLTAIVQSMDKYHYLHGGIHLVVIDGVADLIRCANDEAESVALIDEIYRLAGIYRTCIAAVVHFVPNGLKLRGHLGSELQRKSAAILSIEKDENPEVSVVKALKVRDGSPLDIPLMQFRWDKQAGMPVYVGEKPRAEKEKRKEKELAEMAREAFARQEKYGYIELCELIQEMLEVKERTAKGYIRYMRERKSSKRRATAMYTDREEFEGWMERIMERFDRTEKLLERVLKKNNTLDGEEVLDNQDLCLLLKVGIRTLQRYRAIGVLPYFTISGKVFYRTKDVHEFIRTRFAEVEERAAKRKEKEAQKAERRRKRGLFP